MANVKKGDFVYLYNYEGWTRNPRDESLFVNGARYIVHDTHNTQELDILNIFGQSYLVCLETYDENGNVRHAWFPRRVIGINPPSDLPTRLSKAKHRRMR